MRVLGLIPARGGSKGVARKNARNLCGKPLVQWTIDAALAARTLGSVVVSTEDQEIARIASSCGARVPFMRPAELARDDSPTLPVVIHALETLRGAGESFDAICLLQPTSPFRKTSDIDQCVELLSSSGADSVVSVRQVPLEYNPYWVFFRLPEGTLQLSMGGTNPIPRRQLLPPAFHRDGTIYVTRSDVIERDNNLYGKKMLGYEMTRVNDVNIDTQADWDLAERIMEERRGVSVRADHSAGHDR